MKNPTSLEQIKIIELLHIIGNLISGGVVGIVGVTGYMILTQDLTPEAKAICYDIINFNLSFIIYTVVGVLSLFVLVGFFVLPVIVIAWIILMVTGAVKHFAGERYDYPLVITFIQ